MGSFDKKYKASREAVIREEKNRSLIWSNNGQQSVCKPGKDMLVFTPQKKRP